MVAEIENQCSDVLLTLRISKNSNSDCLRLRYLYMFISDDFNAK